MPDNKEILYQWGRKQLIKHRLDKTWCLACEHYSHNVSTGLPVLYCGKADKKVIDMIACPEGKWERTEAGKIITTEKGEL